MLAELKDQYGSTKGVLRKLASDAATGIMGDEKDLRRREAVFGRNSKPLPRTPALLDSLKQTANDPLWLAVGASALFSGICGAIANGWGGLVEGVSIVIASFILILIATGADLVKDRRFVEL